MTSLVASVHGCAAVSRGYGHILTLGTSGSPNQIGYSDPLSLNYGSLNNLKVRGSDYIIVLSYDSVSGGTPGFKLSPSLVISGTWNASDFQVFECGKVGGSSYRFLFTDPGLIIGHLASGGGFPTRTQFNWNPYTIGTGVPGVALWTPADVGKKVFVALQ